MKKLLLAVALSACCGAASAATLDITSVLTGTDNGFGFSGFHFAGEDTSSNNPADFDGDATTGSALAGFDSTPISGTYNDVTGDLNMVLGLTGATGTVTLTGTGFLFDASSPNALSNISTLSVEFSNPTDYLFNTFIEFDNSIVCCDGASPAPNSFDGTLMSLWGADYPQGIASSAVVGGPELGLDLRIEVAAVPVPAAVWLFGSGLLGLAGIARRRKA